MPYRQGRVGDAPPSTFQPTISLHPRQVAGCPATDRVLLKPPHPDLRFDSMTGTFLPTSAFWTSAKEEPPPEVWLRVQRLRDAAAGLQPPVSLEPWQELEWLLKKSDHLVGCMHRYPHRWRMIGTQKVRMDWLINGQQLLPVGAKELLLRPSRPNSFKTPEEKKFAAQQHFLWTKASLALVISSTSLARSCSAWSQTRRK